MGKDGRLYAKFTLDFPEHEKVLPLSDAAFRCLVEATIWSRKRMTDGWLARRLAVAKWSLDVLQELSTNDPLYPSLIESEQGWQIRDFDEHQDTREEIEARRERNRIAGQKGGIAKGKRGAKRGASKPSSKVSSETVAETETGGARENLLPNQEPRKRCPTHLNREVVPNCGACADARRAYEAWERRALDRKRAAKQARLAQIAECDMCDQNGMVELPSGLEHCNHSIAEVSCG